ncbi:hypothetical protein N7478_012075 [Penicillium angulare]|uniref:uncharacterized protein n=1 Tax=Penicillium angulare TaxID=116970 RepID=UPI0025403605|nr:uncharacterized protein N7478_012075 [Penicillium angulare]KAJ5260470.1 hypothetical protein N7478_012075 [Penicillium angulare]
MATSSASATLSSQTPQTTEISNENSRKTRKEPLESMPEILESMIRERGDFRKARLAHIEGWRFLGGGLLISSLEVTIIGTALITISSHLGDFERSAWVVTTYLATYCAFVIVFARVSDIFGRRTTWLVALGFFVLASVACGAAQTMTQLIVFRALQGIGGGGLYALAMTVATEVPGKLRAPINSILSSVFALASAAGPLIGGAIATGTSWRWVFLLNVPIGVVVFIVSFIIFPTNPFPLSYSLEAYRRIDYVGFFLSVGSIELLALSLQSGGVNYRWDSGSMIALLTITGCCWIAFFAWEMALSSKLWKSKALPIWPCNLFFRRIIGSGLLAALFSGIGFIAVIVYLPQRFQIQNGDPPIMAGVRMLAYLLVSSLFAGLAAVAVVFKNVLFPLMLFSSIMQIVGLGLLSTLPTTVGIFPGQYGYQVILGIGFGIALSVLPLITRMEITLFDHAINMGAVTQSRLIGSLIGVGFGEIVLQSRLWTRLSTILTPEELGLIRQSMSNASKLSPYKHAAVQNEFGKDCNLIFRICMYISIGCLLATLLCYKRKPISIKELEKTESTLATLEAQEIGETSRRGDC